MGDAADAFDCDTWGEPSRLSIELVLSAWRQVANELSPWCAMPLDDRSGELRRLLEELLDRAGGTDSETRRRRIRGVAARHGDFRRVQGCDQSAIWNDFAVLRRAIYRALRIRGVGQSAAQRATHDLGPDLFVAIKAATRAFARPYERSGVNTRWDDSE